MSPPELFEDIALHLLADLQRHQREGAPMHRPDRYLDPFGDTVEAIRWQPGDLVAAGTCIGWLMSSGVDFHHPAGSGGTTTLAIRRPNLNEAVAQPGDWVVGKRRPIAGQSFAAVSAAVFAEAFTADPATCREGATR